MLFRLARTEGSSYHRVTMKRTTTAYEQLVIAGLATKWSGVWGRTFYRIASAAR